MRDCLIHAIRRIALVLVFASQWGCASWSYYGQAVVGQAELWQRQSPIATVMRDPQTSPALRARLQQAQQIRDFAVRELGLPDNQSYRRYADLGRPFVVWTVFAAPPLSLSPRQWCYPIAGCVGYRGFFTADSARAFAEELRQAGDDVYVAGVPAYSTLGWLADPLLNTFIEYPDSELARLLFHELAHQLIYLRDDSGFNESFATVVETVGVARWLADQANPQLEAQALALIQARRRFQDEMTNTRILLEQIYTSTAADSEQLTQKAQVLKAVQERYHLQQVVAARPNAEHWFRQPLGNAHFVAVTMYHQQVSAFNALLVNHQGDLLRFYQAVRELAQLSLGERLQRLTALREQHHE